MPSSITTGWVVELFTEDAWWPQRLLAAPGPTVYSTESAAQGAIETLLTLPGAPRARELRAAPWPRAEELVT